MMVISLNSYLTIKNFRIDNVQAINTIAGFLIKVKNLTLMNSFFNNSNFQLPDTKSILSKGCYANIMFSGEMNILDTSFANSKAFYGGAIYIETKGYSLININRVSFINT